jgi:hypothetical protein
LVSQFMLRSEVPSFVWTYMARPTESGKAAPYLAKK